MTWTQLALCLAGIAALAGYARWAKLHESRIGDEVTARRFAAAALVGFRGGRALVATRGDAALVAGDGAVAVLRRERGRVAVRRLIPPLVIRETVEGAVVETGASALGAVVLFGVLTAEVRALEVEAAAVYAIRQ